MKFVLIVTFSSNNGTKSFFVVICLSMEEVSRVGQSILRQTKWGKITSIRDPEINDISRLSSSKRLDFNSFMTLVYNT